MAWLIWFYYGICLCFSCAFFVFWLRPTITNTANAMFLFLMLNFNNSFFLWLHCAYNSLFSHNHSFVVGCSGCNALRLLRCGCFRYPEPFCFECNGLADDRSTWSQLKNLKLMCCCMQHYYAAKQNTEPVTVCSLHRCTFTASRKAQTKKLS